MQEYFCHKCERSFAPQDESQCHMIPDSKAKFTWVFECEECFSHVITPEEFKLLVKETKARLKAEGKN
jgi:DNA-directed RNA polymerase subunit RPC12/RpoP